MTTHHFENMMHRKKSTWSVVYRGRYLSRVKWVDNIRGMAIVLMILDHTFLFAFPHTNILRLTVTRAALPLFMVLSGFLLREVVSAKRMIQVLVTGISITSMMWYLSFPVPDILLVYGLVSLSVRDFICRYPLFMAVTGLLQLASWPIPWSGYQPGLILGFLCLGQLARKYWWTAGVRDPFVKNRISEFTHLIDKRTVFSVIGRYPLSIYFVHTLVLVIIKVAQ